MNGLTVRKNATSLSFLFALVYMLFCSAFIYISGHIAANASYSVKQLEVIDLVKGLVFVIVTGTFFFVFLSIFLRRIARQMLQIDGQSELIAKQREHIAESEQRALAGTFAASTAHDINNVLSIVTFSVEEMNNLPDLSDDSRKYLLQVQKAFGMIASMAKRLMAIGKQKVWNDIVEVDMNGVVSQAVDMALLHTKIHSCRVSVLVPSLPLVIRTNPRIIEQCVLNLMLNAAEAQHCHCKIEVLLREEKGAAIIEVHDDGPGIPQAERTKIFEAFYTTKVHGTGLGLVGVKVSVELLSGSIEIGESSLGGAMVRLVIPTVR